MRTFRPAAIVAAIAAAFLSSSVFAADESGKTVQQVGSQNSGTSFVVFNEPLQVGCLYNTIYLPDPNSAYGKSMLAILLTAESSGRGVRVVYSQASDGTCTASLIAS